MTESDEPVQTVTAAEMRALDEAEASGYPVTQMVEHAGRHLASLVARLGGWRAGAPRVAVLVGTGGNGAGVLAAARHLANGGARVRALLTGDLRPTPDGAVAERQLHLAVLAGVEVAQRNSPIPAGADIVLDGIVGYGLTGPLRGERRLLVEDVQAAYQAPSTLIVSLDVPSGMHPDDGTADSPAVRPAATMTVALPKRGLLSPSAGEIWLADIGIPRGVFLDVGLAEPPSTLAPEGLLRLRRERTEESE